MENPPSEFFQIQENSDASAPASGISPYVSCIRINGRPILPPLVTEDKRRELNMYRQKAIEIECKMAERKQRSATFVKMNTISTSDVSLTDISPNKQSTPARPVTLQLVSNIPARTFVLSSSELKTSKNASDRERSKVRRDINSNVNSDSPSSQKSTNKLKNKSFRSTLEQRLANEENVNVRNRRNLFDESPIAEEENYPLIMNDYADSDDSRKDRKSWSPLKIDTINSLRVELSNKDSQLDENLCVSLDDQENSSGTLTASPNLMRQNSYTLLAPSPALLQFLETQKEEEGEQTKRSQSGRKTWDLTKAKKKWVPGVPEAASDDKPSRAQESEKVDGNPEKLIAREGGSLDGFSGFHTSSIRNSSPNEPRNPNSYTDEGSTSPSSYSFKGNSPKFQKIKCKIKVRRVKPHKSVPSPKPTDKVPDFGSNSTQGPETVFVPLHVREELTDLSNLLRKMQMEHERQKKELEEKQKTEMKGLQLLLKRRESELLQRIPKDSPAYPRSIYSQYSDPRDSGIFHAQMMGDGRHIANVAQNRGHQGPASCSLLEDDDAKRPQSAKDYYTLSYIDRNSRRTRSMDFNQSVPNQDTDFDISFQDSLQSKDTYIGNEDIIETDTLSNFSSHSSTMSSDTKLDAMPLLDVKKFRAQDISPEEYQKYNQAAAVITAAARGFLTRRLLRTSHVQGLITTLRDAISCATQLHGASDLGESDVDLMKRLGRQIEAAWEAVYAVFFDTDTTTKMQFIAADRERLRSISTKLSSVAAEPKKRISSATLKSLRRKTGSELLMSKSQIANGSSKSRRIRPRMIASYPNPAVQYKLK